jgi:hypothetical protein
VRSTEDPAVRLRRAGATVPLKQIGQGHPSQSDARLRQKGPTIGSD